MEKTFDPPLNTGNVEITKVLIHSRKKPVYMSGKNGISYRSKPRIYLSIERFNPIHDIGGERWDKPHKAIRPLVARSLNEAWAGLNIADAEEFGLKWNPHAGCSMCPCSPGFVVSGFKAKIEQEDEFQWDAWITYRYVGVDAGRNPSEPTEIIASG